MDSDSDSYFEESSDNEQEVAGPLNINIELNLEEAPEMPPPGSPPPQPGAPFVWPVPIPAGELAPVWELPDDGTNFINYFTRADVLELKNWSIEKRARMNQENYVVEAAPVSQSFWAFLQYFHGQQWEVKFLKPAAIPLLDQMLAYISGYARLTSWNKSLFRQHFANWSFAEKTENLRLLAESGGFLEIE